MEDNNQCHTNILLLYIDTFEVSTYILPTYLIYILRNTMFFLIIYDIYLNHSYIIWYIDINVTVRNIIYYIVYIKIYNLKQAIKNNNNQK